jgi:hypothetical protein
MPPEYLAIFLEDPNEVDAYLGEYEEDGGAEPAASPSLEELQQDPDVKAVLAAAELAA